MNIVDEVKQKTDIVEIIGQYVQLTKSGRTLRAPCPFHSEKKPSFFVYPEQQSWHCFGACNTGGDIFSFIMKKEGVDFGEALRLLAEKTGVNIPSQAKSRAEDDALGKIFQVNQAAAQYFHNLLLNAPAADKARRYLAERGLNAKSCTDFQLGYSLPGWEAAKQYLIGKGFTENELLEAGLVVQTEETGKTRDRFRNHIMFPIMDDRGRVTGFGARVLDDSFPKYINSPQTRVFDKSGSLYGIHLSKSTIHQKNQAILVEGYMDVIVAHQYGFSNVIAPMGVAITEKQINQIKKLTHSIALALDPDAAGEEAAMRCVSYENTLDSEVKVITLPAGKDPDEVIKEDSRQWQNFVDRAVPVIEYTINMVTGKLDLKTTPGKTEAVNKLLPIIAGVKNGTRQDSYLVKLAESTDTTKEKLESALKSIKTVGKTFTPKRENLVRSTRAVHSSPTEELMLSILLQHPELRPASQALASEYFENSENRAIFVKWKEAVDSATVKQFLDPILHERYDMFLNKYIPPSPIDERYKRLELRLREDHIRNIEKKKADFFALEKLGGTADDIVERGIEGSIALKKIFYEKVTKPGEVNNEEH